MICIEFVFVQLIFAGHLHWVMEAALVAAFQIVQYILSKIVTVALTVATAAVWAEAAVVVVRSLLIIIMS